MRTWLADSRPSIVFTRKTLVDDTFIQESLNWCKSILGIDGSQFCPFSMCQAMPTDLYTKWELNSESGKFKPCQNKMKSQENMVMSNFWRVRPEFKVESSYTTGTQKKIDAYSVGGFCGHCNAVFEAMGWYYQVCPHQKLVFLSPTK